MTPSHSSATHPLARNSSCSLTYRQTKSGNLFRRLFDRAQPATPSSSRADGAVIAGAAHKDSVRNQPAMDGEVADFLHGKVAELWREQRGEIFAADSSNGNSVTGLIDGHATNGATIEPHSREPKRDLQAEPVAASIPTWKRVFDLTLIILSGPIWLPLMLILMLAVRLSSPGPIFYRQERVGFRRSRFLIYKFRSMKVDSETQVHEVHFERLMRESVPMVKLDGKGDPRILPWGRLMRATGLDELPQIFNVIRGEMSLVGPRPCTVPEFDRYARWQQERVNAMPGLTGYWQVNGKNRTTFNEMIEMDIYYSKHLSLALDLTILLQTLPALVEQTFETFSGSRTSNRRSFPSDANTPEGI